MPRTLRPTAVIPIKILRSSGTSLACTLNVSSSGIKIQTDSDIQPGEALTVIHGLRKMPFRVVWAKPEEKGFVAGLVSLVQPLQWGQVPVIIEER